MSWLEISCEHGTRLVFSCYTAELFPGRWKSQRSYYCMFFILPTLVCFRARLSVVLLLLPLFGCSQAPAPATCRSQLPPQQVNGTAACLLIAKDGVLLLENEQYLLSLPALDTTDHPDAQCALHQHIWHQTGINVEVGARLIATKKGLTIYHCEESAGLAGITHPFSTPDWTHASLAWVSRDPFALTIKAMANRDELIPLRDAFTRWKKTTTDSKKE